MRGIGEAENRRILQAALKQSVLGICHWYDEYQIKSDTFAHTFAQGKWPQWLQRPPQFYRADIAAPELGIIVEVNGYYHSTRKQRVKDAVRRTFLYRAGWFVIEVSEDEIPHNLGAFLENLDYYIRLVLDGIKPSDWYSDLLYQLDAKA